MFRDEKWTILRKALSPTFTSGKLKGMTAHMDCIVDNMMKHLEQCAGHSQVIDVKKVFQSLSLDIIANCAFGVDTNSFQDPENILFKRSNQAFSDIRLKSMFESIMTKLIGLFPFLIDYFDGYGKENFTFMRDITKSIAMERKLPRGDFIDRFASTPQKKHIKS